MSDPTESSHSISRVLDAALRLLAHRPRSEAEVRRRLSRRFASHQVEEAIASLRKQGLLDDAAFADFWLRSREDHRPRSALAIRWELLRLGVDGEVVEETLEGMDEEESAFRAGSKLLGRLGGLDYDTFRKRMIAYLNRRGFPYGIAHRVTERLWADASHSHVHGDAGDE
jgi:regulatory protein